MDNKVKNEKAHSSKLEARVGPFYFIGEDPDSIEASTMKVSDTEAGRFANHSSHWVLWDRIQSNDFLLQNIEYDTFPRGRVLYDREENKYMVYMDPFLNGDKYKSAVAKTFCLPITITVWDFNDEHYTSDYTEGCDERRDALWNSVEGGGKK